MNRSTHQVNSAKPPSTAIADRRIVRLNITSCVLLDLYLVEEQERFKLRLLQRVHGWMMFAAEPRDLEYLRGEYAARVINGPGGAIAWTSANSAIRSIDCALGKYPRSL
jgi:hypothetical protein